VVKDVLVDTQWHETFAKLGVWQEHAEPNTRWKQYAKPHAEVVAKAPNDDEIEMLVGRHRLDLARRFIAGPRRLIDRREAVAAAAAPPLLEHDAVEHPPAIPRGARLLPPAPPLPPPHEPASASDPE
jgi:hypothetical protein